MRKNDYSFVGLHNLGNTCYMNSAIQCLFNSTFLTEYLLKDDWSNKINKNNPMGSNGKILLSYYQLIKILHITNNK